MFGITGGQLRHRVEIQQRGVTVDEAGQQTTTWTTIKRTNAKVEPVSAKELSVAGMTRAELSHRVTLYSIPILQNPQIAAALRILFKGRIFNISGVTNLQERSIFTVLDCSEGLNNG